MEIRLANADDALAVAQIHVRSWQVGYWDLLPADYLHSLRAEDRAARYDLGNRDPSRPVSPRLGLIAWKTHMDAELASNESRVTVRRRWNSDQTLTVNVDALWDFHFQNDAGGVCRAQR